MNAFCFAAQSLARSAAAVAGVQPLTSPPTVLETFNPGLLAGRDLVVFKMHGLEGQPYWYGDGFVTACSAEQIMSADMIGALVFVANCFGGPASPMIQALLHAGARAVVTGTGLNYAGVTRLAGADVIGFTWRRLLELGMTAEDALRFGKLSAKLRRPALSADIDSFELVGAAGARLGRKSNASKGQA